jgi:MFS family permease
MSPYVDAELPETNPIATGVIQKWDLMNRRIRLTLALSLILSSVALSQSLEEINTARNRTTRTGMMVLGGWAIANIISAPIGSSLTTGPDRYFHQMNGYWNLINLGLAVPGFINTLKYDPKAISLTESLAEQADMEKLLLFNAGLDIGYVLGGLYLLERSRRGEKRADLYKGFGRSIMLQGTFLFLFDLSFYYFLHQHQADLNGLIPQIGFYPGGIRLGLTF